jgi:hypothetical protein
VHQEEVCGSHYGEDFTRGFDTQNYPKLQASLGTQPENTHRIQRQTQPNPYPWIFSGNTLGYPWVPTLNFYPWVPWVPILIFYPWVLWVPALRKAESKVKSSKPKKRTVELSISSDWCKYWWKRHCPIRPWNWRRLWWRKFNDSISFFPQFNKWPFSNSGINKVAMVKNAFLIMSL